MSTRAYIAIENKDGTVRSVYSHFDNYLEGTGKILFNHYKTEDRVNKLIDLGDISSIGTEPVADWTEDKRKDNICYTYKARGESDVDAVVYKDEKEFLENCCEDYTYLFKNGEWLYRNWDYELKELKSAFITEEDSEDEK